MSRITHALLVGLLLAPPNLSQAQELLRFFACGTIRFFDEACAPAAKPPPEAFPAAETPEMPPASPPLPPPVPLPAPPAAFSARDGEPRYATIAAPTLGRSHRGPCARFWRGNAPASNGSRSSRPSSTPSRRPRGNRSSPHQGSRTSTYVRSPIPTGAMCVPYTRMLSSLFGSMINSSTVPHDLCGYRSLVCRLCAQ
jgi:hypothetical protein